jgi:predicted nucleotidyltransferase
MRFGKEYEHRRSRQRCGPSGFLKGIGSVRPRIERLILFGSRARGTHQFDSDYDLLLVVAKKDNALVDVLYEAAMDILLTHGRLVSLKIFEEREFARLQALQTPFMKTSSARASSLDVIDEQTARRAVPEAEGFVAAVSDYITKLNSRVPQS